jgi:hypothetical protein
MRIDEELDSAHEEEDDDDDDDEEEKESFMFFDQSSAFVKQKSDLNTDNFKMGED